MAMQNPPHPGGIVRRQCLEPLGLSVTKAAEHINRLPDREAAKAAVFIDDSHLRLKVTRLSLESKK